MLSEG
jgi:hypothetical protein